jgi:hypothetical protein
VVFYYLTPYGVVGDHGGLGRLRRVVFLRRESAVLRQGGPFLLLEGVQRTRIRHGFGVSEGSRDLGVTAHEGSVVLPRPPRGNSEGYKRTPGDVKPSRHASGEQVRAYLGAGPHGLKCPKNSGRRGEPWFRAFCGFLKDAFTHFKRLSELQDAKLAPLLLTLIVQ